MLGRRSFKSDESFLEKLTIGAVGTRAVFEDLKRQKHEPIELERGSMSYKLWKSIKIKRLRVPDLLCLRCSARVEARAKTKLELSMSHSTSDPARGWDRGLTDRDMVAFSLCRKTGEGPTDWAAANLIQYVPVSALRKAFKADQVVAERPKGAQEGFELRVTWPATIASMDGVVTEVTKERVTYKRDGGRSIGLRLGRKGLVLKPLVKVGDTVRESQVMASVVPAGATFPCGAGANERTYLALLGSSSVEERYTAAKALSSFRSGAASKALRGRMDDAKEHVYVRLDSAASLARQGDPAGMAFIGQTLQDPYLENQLEAVIILGEIRSGESEKALTDVLLDKARHPEIRAGAAWALGELNQASSADALMQTFLEMDETVRTEAARALRRLAQLAALDLTPSLKSSQGDQRAGVAWAIAQSGKVDARALAEALVDDDARRWVAYIIGSQREDQYLGQLESMKKRDPEVYFAITVLWKILSSWIQKI